MSSDISGQNFRVTGMQAVVDGIGKVYDAGLAGMYKGVRSAADEILRMAKYYVPKDTLALMNSGRVELELSSETKTRATAKFGDSTAYYAIYVHENLEKWHAPPTQAKFLDRAIWELYAGNLGGIITYEIASEIARSVRGTGGGFDALVRRFGE